MRDFYTIKEIILGLRSSCLNFNASINQLNNCVVFYDSKKKKPCFFIYYPERAVDDFFSIKYVTLKEYSKYFKAIDSRLFGTPEVHQVASSTSSDIFIPKEISKYVVDKDRYYSLIKEMLSNDFLRNHVQIVNPYYGNYKNNAIPNNPFFVNKIDINSNGVKLYSEKLKSNFCYDSLKDCFSYNGISEWNSDNCISDYLNISISNNQLNDFLIGLIDSNLFSESDIIFDKNLSFDICNISHDRKNFDLFIDDKQKRLSLSLKK